MCVCVCAGCATGFGCVCVFVSVTFEGCGQLASSSSERILLFQDMCFCKVLVCMCVSV